jgi:hypothetical protein
MVRSRLGLKVLGLCALALGLMAFVANAAQAETAARWKVAGKEVTGTESFPTEIKELEGKTASLLFTTKSGTKVTILCTEAKFDEGGALIKEGGLSLGRILFKGCVTLLNGALSPPCKPKGGGAPSGEILSERGKGLITLDKIKLTVEGKEVIDTEDYVKITPENAKGEATKLFSKIELGAECAIGEFVNVESTSLGEGLWIKDCKGNGDPKKEPPVPGFTTEATTHLIEESLHQLLALGQPATIDGSAIVQLTGGTTAFSGTPG